MGHRQSHVKQLAAEWMQLKKKGLSEQALLQHFSYLHPITLSRLKNYLSRAK